MSDAMRWADEMAALLGGKTSPSKKTPGGVVVTMPAPNGAALVVGVAVAAAGGVTFRPAYPGARWLALNTTASPRTVAAEAIVRGRGAKPWPHGPAFPAGLATEVAAEVAAFDAAVAADAAAVAASRARDGLRSSGDALRYGED